MDCCRADTSSSHAVINVRDCCESCSHRMFSLWCHCILSLRSWGDVQRAEKMMDLASLPCGFSQTVVNVASSSEHTNNIKPLTSTSFSDKFSIQEQTNIVPVGCLVNFVAHWFAAQKRSFLTQNNACPIVWCSCCCHGRTQERRPLGNETTWTHDERQLTRLVSWCIAHAHNQNGSCLYKTVY